MFEFIQKFLFKSAERTLLNTGVHPDEWNLERVRFARDEIRKVSTLYIWGYIHSQNFTENDMFDIEDTDFTKGDDAMIEHFLDMMGYR